MAQYPPGSTFKLPQVLIALQHEVITVNSGFPCDKSILGCHNHPNARSIKEGIEMSCNPYFYFVFHRMLEQNIEKSRFLDARLGLSMWKEDMQSFGLGQRLGIDLPSCKPGLLPDTTLLDRIYGVRAWAASNLRSESIGQGNVLLVPLQMANIAAIMANRGFYITPHLCRKIGDSIPNVDFVTKHYTNVDKKWFDEAVIGMFNVVNGPYGTGHNASIPGVVVCGKTGTAQNKIKGKDAKDHAVFIGFAPMDNPKIAISVFVENSGFGGTWAAPIASLLIEQYLNGEIKRPELLNRMKTSIN
jgi:penicillin-binding protein 2